MKVVWNLAKTKAIPIDKIAEFEIVERLHNYGVVVSYAICIGCREVVFEADTKEKCVEFINNLGGVK